MSAPNPYTWRKSTSSGSSGTNCVEARVNGPVEIRDSKDPEGPRISLSSEAFRAFTASIKAGELDKI